VAAWVRGRLDRFPPNVLALGLVSFLTDISSEMIFAVLPFYLTEVLGASPAIFGLIEGLAEGTSAILKGASGVWSDKVRRRKPFVLAGYALSAIVKPLFAFATVWPAALALRVGDRVGKGIRTAPRDAIIAGSTDKATRGAAFGLHRFMDTMGAVVGPLLALALLPALGYSNLFLLTAIPGILAVGVIWFYVKEAKASSGAPVRFTLSGLPREYVWYLAVSAVFALANFSWAFYLLRARDLGQALGAAIGLYLIYNMSYALLSYPAGRLSDRLGRRTVIAAGYTLFIVTALGFAYVPFGSPVIIGLFVLYGGFMAVYEGVQRAYVSDLVEEGHRASALGIFNTVLGIGALAAGIWAGVVWQFYGFQSVFAASAGVAAVALMAFVASARRT
jgi:MFS family permease